MKSLNKSIQLAFLVLSVLLALFAFGCSTEYSTRGLPADSPSPAPESTASPSLPLSAPPQSIATSKPAAAWSEKLLQHGSYQNGDRGDEVLLLQNMLIELGLDPGEPDGVYGVQLTKAIRNFQLYAGLSPDGIAGEKTAAALLERYNDALTACSQTDKPLQGHTIGIDPGHQRHDNDGLEPVMPGSQELKKMVSAGTVGRYTGVPEYVINLQVGLKLKRKLAALGADVIMTRQTHGVDISNADRAMLMNDAGVDCWLRIHANGEDDPNISGMFILVADKGCMNSPSDGIQKQSVVLADKLLTSAVSSTGAMNLGIKIRTDQTGFGWSSVPVCNIEMGHMTNKTEDYLLVSERYQNQIADGLCAGFIEYFDHSSK